MPYGDCYALKDPSGIGKRLKALLNQRIYNRIAANFEEKPLTILEIGVGHGFFAEVCKSSGQRFYGVEPHPVMYKDLIKRHFQVKQYYSPPIPYDDDEFDIVYCGYLLEFLKDVSTAYEFILECRRVLRPNGIIAIVSSDCVKMKEEFWNVSYMASFATSERRVKQLFYDVGFEHIKTVHFAGNLFGPWRYLAYIFYKIYSYDVLNFIFCQRNKLDSKFYKFRVTFPEGFLILGRKVGQ
jgi:SAM-dependent methyltransferase